MINNTRPAFLSNGALNTAEITAGTAAPPSTLRTIGDALNEQSIPWAYYGGGFNAARRFDNGSTDPVDVLIGTGGDWYCDICNSFQYAASIMGNPAQRAAHIKDLTDFFTDVHASILKFIERNWDLKPLTARSRDNLPNPVATPANPYVPVNMPAIGDLFDMFDFDLRRDDRNR